MLADIQLSENDEFYGLDTYMTKLGEINRPETIAILSDHSAFHSLTKTDIFRTPNSSLAFIFNDRYLSHTFQGIMPDSGAAGVSTAGQSQLTAL
jgi:hypothetical protein